MHELADLLSSRVKAELFRLMFGLAEAPIHARELHRRSGLGIGAVQQELRKLVGPGFIAQRRDGNRVCYSANREHPWYEDIHRMVLKTSGLADVARESLTAPGSNY